MTNTNCLANIKCPKCGNEDDFRIEALIVCQVTDEGSEPSGDHHWDKDSHCLCPDCQFEGGLSDFFLVTDERSAAATAEATDRPSTGQGPNPLSAPWSLHFDRDGTEDFGVIFDSEDREIVSSQHSKTCWLPQSPDDTVPVLVHQMRVMKAAPKLLEALDNLVIGIGMGWDLDGLVNQAMDAIKEATDASPRRAT